MRAKISPGGRNFEDALLYNFKKYEVGHADILYKQLLPMESSGRYSYNRVKERFEHFGNLSSRVKKPVFHASLNPHPKDVLSDKQLIEIAKDYMQSLGYGEQPYMIFKHHDIERVHLHIVSCRVGIEGKKVPDKFEKQRSARICFDLERKYNLVQHQEEKKKEQAKNMQPVCLQKGNVKEQVQSLLQAVLVHYKFQSLGEMNTVLAGYNLSVQETQVQKQNGTYKSILYIPLDTEGKRGSVPLSGKDLGRGFGIDAIERKMQKSKEQISSLMPELRDKVRRAKEENRQKNALIEALQKERIQVVFRTNENGRIYGVTFIDETTGAVANGSRLGKEFSANVWNEWLKNDCEIDNLKTNDAEEKHGENTIDETTEPLLFMDLPYIEDYTYDEVCDDYFELISYSGGRGMFGNLFGGDTEQRAEQIAIKRIKHNQRKRSVKLR